VTSNASSISQAAGVAALEGPEEELRAMVADYRRRRDYVVERLNRLPGVRCTVPDGAFYVFPDIGGLVGRRLGETVIADGDALAEALLEHARVALVPGSGFGMPYHVRLSYACSMEDIREGLDRIEAVLRRMVA
jgi:aspartate aminotransferase